MHKIREILRLRWTSQFSNRESAKICSTARSTVAGCLERASNAALLACQEFSSPWHFTFKQAQDMGGHVIKGSKNSRVYPQQERR